MENNVMKPHRIVITETYVKEVEIYAPDAYTAMQHAEDLCNQDVISFDFDNFVDRNTECRGFSRASDLQLHEVFQAEEGAVARPVLDTIVYHAFLAGNAIYMGTKSINDIKITMDETGQLFCRFSDECETRPLRDNIADIKEGDAFFWNERGLICTAAEDAHKDRYNDHEWAVYGSDGEPYFDDDIGKEIGKRIREVLSQARQSKPSLTEQVSAAEQRTGSVYDDPFLPTTKER